MVAKKNPLVIKMRSYCLYLVALTVSWQRKLSAQPDGAENQSARGVLLWCILRYSDQARFHHSDAGLKSIKELVRTFRCNYRTDVGDINAGVTHAGMKHWYQSVLPPGQNLAAFEIRLFITGINLSRTPNTSSTPTRRDCRVRSIMKKDST